MRPVFLSIIEDEVHSEEIQLCKPEITVEINL